jgi:hypothetical protein
MFLNLGLHPMANSESQPVVLGGDPTENRTVVLPCEPDQFRDFIAGLLGRPQTIERSIRGPFEVNKIDIENIHHLIEQRLSSQNEATLVQFTARIVYDDDSSVLLNSFFDFTSYNEVKPLRSVAAHLGWTWLVQFRNKKYPEKQQIDISFYGGPVSASREEYVSSTTGLVRVRSSTMSGGIQVRISHTDRTWGTDIDALLDGQLQTLVTSDTSLRGTIRRHAGGIGFIFWLILFSGSLVSSVLVVSRLISAHMVNVTSFTLRDPITIEQLAREINLVMQYLITYPTIHDIIYAIMFDVVALIVSITLAIQITELASGLRRSFVLLTIKAIEERDKWHQSPKDSLARFLLSVFGALIISVIGNLLFYLALKYWTN